MSDIDDAIAALARAEGKSQEQMREELLRDGVKARVRTATGGITRRERDRPLEGEFDDEAPRPRRRDDEESPAEARARWLAEEEALLDGVHGWAGQEAGGIFGSGPIATETYDPQAHHRAASRAAAVAQVQQAQALAALGSVVGRLADRMGLHLPESPVPPRRLRGR